METLQRNRKTLRQAAAFGLIVLAAAIVTGCSHVMMMIPGGGPKRPAAAEFGLGPRSSANGMYVATLEPTRELRPRQMQTVRILVTDGEGRAIENARLAIDGGMPQHGHGLPTRPRMTRSVAAGSYEVEGVRFNMGGWWEFKVTITSERGADTVTFNLSL